MIHNVTDGHYWATEVPTGKYAVFWTHPNYADWHVNVAEFGDSTRAIDYCDMCNDCLNDETPCWEEALKAPPAMLPPPPKLHSAPIKRSIKLPPALAPAYRNLTEKLVDLFASFPAGVPATAVSSHVGVDIQTAYVLCRFADAEGAGKWVHADPKQWQKKFLLPPDSDAVDAPVASAEAVMTVLRENADARRCATMSFREIADAAKTVPQGSVSDILYRLNKAGRIMLARPGTPTSPATYQILDTQPRGTP
mgnify:CR=1 FL=1